mgnify:CR=1 FL=1
MFKSIIAAAAMSALGACAASADPETNSAPAAASAEVSCDVRFTPSAGVLRIEALARAAVAASGEYEMVVTKEGPSGSSDISQSGPFEINSDAELALSASEFGVEPGDHYSARLRLRDDDGELCRVERRS